MLKKTANHLTRKQKRDAHTLLYEYTNLFAKSDSDLGRTDIIRHKIDTGTTRPVKIPTRRVHTHLTKEIDKHLEDMLERGVIEPSNSPWPAPVVLVKKKDGKYRFCIDYRKLKSNTINDAYPLPWIDESLDQLSVSSWFSTLYLSRDIGKKRWIKKTNQRPLSQLVEDSSNSMSCHLVYAVLLQHLNAEWKAYWLALTGTYVSSF